MGHLGTYPPVQLATVCISSQSCCLHGSTCLDTCELQAIEPRHTLLNRVNAYLTQDRRTKPFDLLPTPVNSPSGSEAAPACQLARPHGLGKRPGHRRVPEGFRPRGPGRGRPGSDSGLPRGDRPGAAGAEWDALAERPGDQLLPGDDPAAQRGAQGGHGQQVSCSDGPQKLVTAFVGS